jgi:hypothetical protein
MNRVATGVLMLIILVWGFSACRSGKKPVRKDVTVDSVAVEETPVELPFVVPELSPEKQELINRLLPLKEQEISFTTFSGKAKMRYEGGGEKQEFVASIRIRKDSVIWVSVSALGGLVQVARALVTPDSIRLINYLQREVIAMPASDARRLLPADLDFATLQNILIGNLPRNGGVPTDATDFGGTWSLQLEDRQYVQQLAYNKSDSTLRSSQVRTQPDLPQTALVMQFGNYETVGGQRFAATRALNIITGEGQYYLDMHFNGVAIDEPTDFPFSIPKKYTMK